MKAPTIPAGIDLQPIDDAARNGRPQLVFGGAYFAFVRFIDSTWRFPNGVELDFTPTHYRAEVHRV